MSPPAPRPSEPPGSGRGRCLAHRTSLLPPARPAAPAPRLPARRPEGPGKPEAAPAPSRRQKGPEAGCGQQPPYLRPSPQWRWPRSAPGGSVVSRRAAPRRPVVPVAAALLAPRAAGWEGCVGNGRGAPALLAGRAGPVCPGGHSWVNHGLGVLRESVLANEGEKKWLLAQQVPVCRLSGTLLLWAVPLWNKCLLHLFRVKRGKGPNPGSSGDPQSDKLLKSLSASSRRETDLCCGVC